MVIARLIAASTSLLYPLQEAVDYTDLASVLLWIAVGGGGAALVSMAFTYIAENCPTWHTLPYAVKFFVPMAVSIVLGVAAQAALQYMPGTIDLIAPWFKIAALSVIAWLAGQKTYIGIKRVNAEGVRYGADKTIT